ncbi:MAG TPA: hypothetical protein VNT57_05230, partial [Desulfobacteria bacterium]|nr:hypothetical protein [Desulfobacteria bacterium]
MKRTVHVLIHNFFVTAICAEQPELNNFPVAVVKKNKVIDASPRLNAAGVVTGMSKHQAARLCPDGRFVQLKDEIITGRSLNLALQCGALSPRVEIFNENEAFLDLSGSKPFSVSTFAILQKALVPHLGSFVTITVAPNRLLARAAALSVSSDTGKKFFSIPGMSIKNYDKMRILVVQEEKIPDLVSYLPVEAMWPLENRITKQLKSLGLKTFADISRIPLTMLHQQFGSLAPIILNFSNGKDDSNVPVFHPPDKVLYHTTCSCSDRLQLETLIKDAAISAARSLQDKGKAYRELSLSLFFDDGKNASRVLVFTRGKADINSLYHDSLNLLNKILTGGIKEKVTDISLSAG